MLIEDIKYNLNIYIYIYIYILSLEYVAIIAAATIKVHNSLLVFCLHKNERERTFSWNATEKREVSGVRKSLWVCICRAS